MRSLRVMCPPTYMEFGQWLVTFGRDLEILVIIWMDLCHVTGPTVCQVFDQHTEWMWANKLWYVLARDPAHPSPGTRTLVASAMLFLIVFLRAHFHYNQDHGFFRTADGNRLTREIVIIPNLAGAFWPWVATLISISRCHLSIHLRTAALAPSLSAWSGRAANFLLGAILSTRRGPRVSHQVHVLSFKCVTEKHHVSQT